MGFNSGFKGLSMKHSAKCRAIYLRLLRSDEFDIIADKES